jgi:hypothetical protein
MGEAQTIPPIHQAGDVAILLTEGWGYMRVELGALKPSVTLAMMLEEYGAQKHEDADFCDCSACRAMQVTAV